MVRTGCFELLLIDAVTKQPLLEKVDGEGKVWVKGDPGDEFFVQVISSMPRGTDVDASVKVDGNDLGYGWVTHGPDRSDMLGPAKGGDLENNVVHAFKFVRHENKTVEEDDDDGPGPLPAAGTVQVNWHLTYKTAKTYDTPSSSCASWQAVASDAHASSHNKKEMATLKAGVGSAPSQIAGLSNAVYEKGQHIATATIHYTTDFGMAVRGLYTEDEVRPPPALLLPAPKKAKTEKKEAAGTSQQTAISVDD